MTNYTVKNIEWHEGMLAEINLRAWYRANGHNIYMHRNNSSFFSALCVLFSSIDCDTMAMSLRSIVEQVSSSGNLCDNLYHVGCLAKVDWKWRRDSEPKIYENFRFGIRHSAQQEHMKMSGQCQK